MSTLNALRAGALVLVGVALAGGGYWYGTTRNVPSASGVASPSGTTADASAKQGGVRSNKGEKGGGGGVQGAGGNAGGPVLIRSTQVKTIELPQIISTVGSLRSDESVTLRPEAAGRIVAIKFQEGQQITKGTTLFQLDATTNQAELQQARTNLSLAKSKYDRAVDLASRNFISGQARDEAKSTFELAQSSLALVDARLAKTEIKAPFSGIIGLRVVSEGDYVREGADLVNLESIDPIKVDFRVPETFLRDVQPGQTVQITLDALPGKTYDGKVLAVNPLLDTAGRSIVVRAQVRNQGTTLRPGMFARVTLITRAKRDALVVPEEALVPQGADNYLFRIVDGKALRIKVETGQRRDSQVEIVTGVEKDAVVVTAGQAKLRDGSPVKIAGKEPAQGAPGAAEKPKLRSGSGSGSAKTEKLDKS